MNQHCKVCGELAAGYHFGAFTCEGCKSFFGRTYNNRSSIGECKNNDQCVINKKNRTSCKSCRLKKCFSVGMSKSGSRYGRRSNWFKIHCLLQDQGIMQQQVQLSQQSPANCDQQNDSLMHADNTENALINLSTSHHHLHPQRHSFLGAANNTNHNHNHNTSTTTISPTNFHRQASQHLGQQPQQQVQQQQQQQQSQQQQQAQQQQQQSQQQQQQAVSQLAAALALQQNLSIDHLDPSVNPINPLLSSTMAQIFLYNLLVSNQRPPAAQ